MNLKYKFGYFVGIATSFFICFYAFFDAYENIINKRSIAADLAVLFSFFAWKKMFTANSILYELYINEIRKGLNEKEGV